MFSSPYLKARKYLGKSNTKVHKAPGAPLTIYSDSPPEYSSDFDFLEYAEQCEAAANGVTNYTFIKENPVQSTIYLFDSDDETEKENQIDEDYPVIEAFVDYINNNSSLISGDDVFQMIQYLKNEYSDADQPGKFIGELDIYNILENTELEFWSLEYLQGDINHTEFNPKIEELYQLLNNYNKHKGLKRFPLQSTPVHKQETVAIKQETVTIKQDTESKQNELILKKKLDETLPEDFKLPLLCNILKKEQGDTVSLFLGLITFQLKSYYAKIVYKKENENLYYIKLWNNYREKQFFRGSFSKGIYRKLSERDFLTF